jgi:hypothetical protein
MLRTEGTPQGPGSLCVSIAKRRAARLLTQDSGGQVKGVAISVFLAVNRSLELGTGCGLCDVALEVIAGGIMSQCW